MNSNSQVAGFIAKADGMLRDAGAESLQRDQPKVPFQSALKLTAEQEKKMIEHAFKRLETLSSESGRNQTQSPTWWTSQVAAGANTALASQGLITVADTFLGKRSRYDATFLNDVSWRPFTMGPESIFNSSNITVPLVRRICRQMIARAINSFFGSDPWFSVDPAPVPEFDQQDDDGRAQRIERFCRFKLHESGSRDDKERAIKRALILGECAVKTSYVVRDQLFNVEARVLTDVDGQAIRAEDGNHITDKDEFADAEDGTGTKVLKRDGKTPMPEAPIYTTQPLNRRQVLFEGARSEPIFFKDFLCPLTATDVQTADAIVHLYDKPVMEFVDLVVKRGMVGAEADDRIEATQKMVALIKEMSNNTPNPKSALDAQNRPNDNFQAAPSVDTGGPISEFAEFYMWFDANEDGVAENIMLIADRKSKAPIFYDHVANVTTDGLRPIEVVRINPVEGRWYGLGIMELFESYGTITDLLVNRWNFSQSRSGRVDFWTPTNTLEGDRDPALRMNWGASYTLKPNCKAEDTCKPVYLTDTKFDAIHTMIQFFMQLAMNESGVTNANDDQAAGMQSAKLATGIIEVSKSGDELFMPIIQDLKGPLERLINREVDVTLANMNPKEVYTYLEGDTLGIDTLTPDDVRNLKFKCQIELTSMKDNQSLQMSAQASALVEKFYMLTPDVQQKVAGFYRRQLRVLDPKADVDNAIQPIQPAPKDETKTAVAVSAKIEMLNPKERAAVMGKLGVNEDPNSLPAAQPAKPTTNGSTHKLGESGAAGSTRFPTQLTQAGNKRS
jgi:hypothetical protein